MGDVELATHANQMFAGGLSLLVVDNQHDQLVGLRKTFVDALLVG